jgi:hypothetical protein
VYILDGTASPRPWTLLVRGNFGAAAGEVQATGSAPGGTPDEIWLDGVVYSIT